MFKIDPIILLLDDPRVKALNSGKINNTEFMKLIKQTDPFHFINGELKYITPEEEVTYRDQYVKSTITNIKYAGRIDANYIYENIEYFKKVFPEIEPIYNDIKPIVDKDGCKSCSLRSHSIKLLNKILEVNKEKRDLSPLDPIKDDFIKKFPHGYKKLALEPINIEEKDIQIPPFFFKERPKILDEIKKDDKSIDIPKHTDRKEVVELLHAISNAAHSEYHLIESMTYNSDKNTIPLIQISNDLRSTRVSLMEKLALENKNVASLWCLFKHILLLQFHLYELYQKKNDSYYLEQIKKVTLMIDDLLSIEGIEDFRDCPRCEEDKKHE